MDYKSEINRDAMHWNKNILCMQSNYIVYNNNNYNIVKTTTSAVLSEKKYNIIMIPIGQEGMNIWYTYEVDANIGVGTHFGRSTVTSYLFNMDIIKILNALQFLILFVHDRSKIV